MTNRRKKNANITEPDVKQPQASVRDIINFHGVIHGPGVVNTHEMGRESWWTRSSTIIAGAGLLLTILASIATLYTPSASTGAAGPKQVTEKGLTPLREAAPTPPPAQVKQKPVPVVPVPTVTPPHVDNVTPELSTSETVDTGATERVAPLNLNSQEKCSPNVVIIGNNSGPIDSQCE